MESHSACNDKDSDSACCAGEVLVGMQNDRKAEFDDFVPSADESVPNSEDSLGKLAIIPGGKQKKPCAFRYEGKPCKLCDDDYDDDDDDDDGDDVVPVVEVADTTPQDAEAFLLAAAAAVVRHQEQVGPGGQASSELSKENNNCCGTLPKAVCASSSSCSSALPATSATATRSLSKKSPCCGGGSSSKKSTVLGVAPGVITTQAPSSPEPPPVTPAEAYERKKQKAKDARIKLNTALDQLSRSITHAGYQSNQRAGELGTQLWREKMQSCSTLAEQVNKNDRPSFVGTAAAMINGLNDQCDALVEEVTRLQLLLQEKPVVLEVPTTVVHERSAAAAAPSKKKCCSKQKSGTPDTLHSLVALDASVPEAASPPKRKCCSKRKCSGAGDTTQSSTLKQQEGCSSKREREDATGCSTARPADPVVSKRLRTANHTSATLTTANPYVGNVFSEAKLLERILLFLDPVALARCMCVSQAWRQSKTMSQVWMERSLQRFGLYQVHQWNETRKDPDETLSGAVLYRSLQETNTIPNFTTDGMYMIGSAQIPGVSAWVYLVDTRNSNGEMLQNVRKEGSCCKSKTASLPVVELRFVVQNTGIDDASPVLLKPQSLTVDVSTPKRAEEIMEISWDDRFRKKVSVIKGSPPSEGSFELSSLGMFDTVVVTAYFHAVKCTPISKFIQRSNHVKILVSMDGANVPLIIPFRDSLPFV